MKNLFKLFGIITLVAVIGFSFAACGDDNSAPPPPPPTHVHQWGDWVVTKAATCTENGEETRTCTIDATHKETEVIPKDTTAHDWGSWIQNIPATYTVDGQETRTCNLNALHKETRIVPQLIFTSISDFATWLAEQSDTTATAIPYYVKLNVSDLGGNSGDTGSAGNVLRTNNTKKVSLDLSGSTFTNIVNSAFNHCDSLRTIKIPDSVTSIGNSAFLGCTSLASVTIPDSVTSIGDSAFADCGSLTSVTIGSGVTSIGSYAFYGPSLTSVTFATGSNIADNNIPSSALPGNLKTVYSTGKAGTYTRTTGGDTWTKQ